MILRTALVLWLVTIFPLGVSAQELPPRPIHELVSDFASDPVGRTDILEMAALCPTPGTWRWDLLTAILALPDNRALSDRFSASLGWTMLNCDHHEPIAEWFRRKATTSDDWPMLRLVVRDLYKTATEENRNAARVAIFNPQIDDDMRTAIAATMIGGDATAGLEQISIGYREHGTAPPSSFLSWALSEAPGAEGLRAKRALLASVLARPAGRGAITIMNAVMSSALSYHTEDPWFRAVVSSAEAIQRHPDASPELRTFLAGSRNWLKGQSGP